MVSGTRALAADLLGLVGYSVESLWVRLVLAYLMDAPLNRDLGSSEHRSTLSVRLFLSNFPPFLSISGCSDELRINTDTLCNSSS